jgi:peptidoglycan/xylan/chitin deacetylase (PgdA/CDA1 family)
MINSATPKKSFSRRRRGVLALSLSLSALTFASCKASYHGFTLPEWWRDVHSGVIQSHRVTNDKIVALTFDDGPDPTYTPRVLATLRRYSLHATFFQEGRMVERFPELSRRVLAEGHAIGNHTYSHPYLVRLSPQQVRQEIDACERCIQKSVGISTTMFRPPRGDWNPSIYKETLHHHEHLILWSVALEHHEVHTPQEMAQRVLNRVKPGDIILMHDGAFVSRETTVQALPILIDGLLKRGYRCVTVPELLHIPATLAPPPVSRPASGVQRTPLSTRRLFPSAPPQASPRRAGV